MAYWFGDGFDCYAATADATLGYWDGGTTGNCQLVTGRFSGSRGLQVVTLSSTVTWLFKNGANDALHHIAFAVQQPAAVSGTSNGLWFTFYDGSTAQCSVVLKSDGSMVLTSGAASGTVQATYSGAIAASGTWYAFEVEVNISNTGGYMNVRKNGNTSNDFSSATNLNTRAGTANSYANRVGIGASSTSQTQHVVDDFLWRSGSSAPAWVGDIRCFTRRPASDALAQWAPNGAANNWDCVDEAQQDALTSYVSSSAPGAQDLYTLTGISSTPSSIVGVTTRGLLIKSDAGTRLAAVQLRSGATTVQAAGALSSSAWGWLWRSDTTDPATGAAWTVSGVAAAQIGAQVTG